MSCLNERGRSGHIPESEMCHVAVIEKWKYLLLMDNREREREDSRIHFNVSVSGWHLASHSLMIYSRPLVRAWYALAVRWQLNTEALFRTKLFMSELKLKIRCCRWWWLYYLCPLTNEGIMSAKRVSRVGSRAHSLVSIHLERERGEGLFLALINNHSLRIVYACTLYALFRSRLFRMNKNVCGGKQNGFI